MDNCFFPAMRNKKTIAPHSSSFRDALPTGTSLHLELFQGVVEQYQQSLFRYFAVHTLGDLSGAQEMTVETFSVAYGKPAILSRQSFTSRLFGIAWDVLNVHESRTMSEAGDASAGRLESRRPGRKDAHRSRMLKILRLLPFYPRETLYLRFFAGLGTRDIVVLMEKNETTIKTLVYQGVLEFAFRMEGREYVALPRKQLLPQAQAYHACLNDVLAGCAPHKKLDARLTQATAQLQALRKNFALKADVASHLSSRLEQIYRSGTSYTTRL